MTRATQAFHKRIALVFDFDLTLAPGSLDALLNKLGVDPDQFRQERVHPLDDEGWDHSLARCYAIVQLSKEQGGSITEETLKEVGREIELFDGLPDAFETVRSAARAIVEDVEVEFYVLTAGYAEIVNATALSSVCKAVWGGTFHYDDNGFVDFPKRVVTYPEKVRYLLALAKGIEVEGHDSPSDVWRDVPDDEYYVPLDQMIYVGDGASDLPAFDLMGDHGGLAIAVTKQGQTAQWGREHEVHADRRVQNLAEASYAEGSELLRSLCLATESIAKMIALRKLGKGE